MPIDFSSYKLSILKMIWKFFRLTLMWSALLVLVFRKQLNNRKCLLRKIYTNFTRIVKICIYIIIDTFVNLCAKSIQNVSIYITSCSEFIYSKVASFLWLQINFTLWHLSAKSDTTPPFKHKGSTWLSSVTLYLSVVDYSYY